nr:RNA-directed DNA polymerase, eukaryota, reverse transcriptase zinc-binding domain protein [Tanacetum cinerariifolium]
MRKKNIMSSLRNIEEKIDAGCTNDEHKTLRVNRFQELDGLEKLESIDLIQKALVKWEVEGDENSKFFYDIINSRRKSQMIKGTFPHGSNSTFITLILKMSNPLYLKDYRPVSLIGIHYNIFSKILANRLSKVIDSIISHEHCTFISGRQILDGPLILSVAIDCTRNRKTKCFCSKLILKKPSTRFHIALMDGLVANMFQGVKFDLKININKSNLYGVGISSSVIDRMTTGTCCVAGSFPFSYLGLPVGGGWTNGRVTRVILCTIAGQKKVQVEVRKVQYEPITCCECEGPLRGGFCLFCNSKAENSFTYDPNAYSFNDTSNNFINLPRPEYETYLCELCENDSRYGYDCSPQFPLVYEQEPSYNQNYNDNYYPHNSPSFLCCDNCGGPHATFQCQPLNQNINSSGFDQIQPPQYPVIHHPSQEMSEEILLAKENLMKFIQTFLKKFNRISFREMPKVLSQAWNKFFEIQHAQPDDTNELLQKLLEDLQIIKNSSNAIAPDLPTKEPEYSLSMGDEHLSTISKTESDELIKFSVENLVSISSEPEVTSDNENTLFDYSLKFDYLEEFSGELITTSIINEKRIRREHEEYISLMEKLLTINSFPRLLENFHANTIIETLPTYPIPVEDSDSLREEIDIFTGTDDLMPPGIESDDYDSERDIHFLEELLSNDSIPLSESESSNFDHHDDPSFPRPPPEPPDVEVFFEPESGVLTTNVVKGISEHCVLMPNILPTLPTFDPLYPVYDTLLSFSSKNEDKMFKPGILSYLLVSHQDKITFDFSKNPMMMYGGDIPLLDVLYLHFYPP